MVHSANQLRIAERFGADDLDEVTLSFDAGDGRGNRDAPLSFNRIAIPRCSDTIGAANLVDLVNSDEFFQKLQRPGDRRRKFGFVRSQSVSPKVAMSFWCISVRKSCIVATRSR